MGPVERPRPILRKTRAERPRPGSLREIRRSNALLRRVAIGAICAWAFIATVAVIALAGQSRRDHTAVQIAQKAVARSEQAVRRDDQAVASAVHASQLAQAIQRSRAAECTEANTRHDRSERVLTHLLRPYLRHGTEAERRALRRRTRATRELINAMVPHYTCSGLTAVP